MKRIFTLFLLFFFYANTALTQGIILLPGYGVQRTVSTVQGTSPVLSSSRQYHTNTISEVKALLNNSKGHGFFLGLSSANHGLSVKTYTDLNSMSRMTSVAIRSRLEIGYQFISKPLYLSNIIDNNHPEKTARGLFFRLQPMMGFGYNFGARNQSFRGQIGAGNTSITGITHRGGNYSFLTGGNLFIGSNKKIWFFISVMKNWNVGKYSSTGILHTQYNGNSYHQRITSTGSGTSFTIGVPIGISKKICGKKRGK